MNVIWAGITFDHSNSFLPRKLSDDLPRSSTNGAIDSFLAILGDNDDVVLTRPRDVGLLVMHKCIHDEKGLMNR